MPPATLFSGHVLVARRGGLLLALPVGVVGNASSVACTPPPPWSPAWVAGLAMRDDGMYPVVDALPDLTVPAPRQPRLVIFATTAPAWALVIDGVEGMATATATSAPLPRLALPSAWAQAGRLGDGRAAVLILPLQIAAHLAGTLAVAS
jgi:hypothetical protein